MISDAIKMTVMTESYAAAAELLRRAAGVLDEAQAAATGARINEARGAADEAAEAIVSAEELLSAAAVIRSL